MKAYIGFYTNFAHKHKFSLGVVFFSLLFSLKLNQLTYSIESPSNPWKFPFNLKLFVCSMYANLLICNWEKWRAFGGRILFKNFFKNFLSSKRFYCGRSEEQFLTGFRWNLMDRLLNRLPFINRRLKVDFTVKLSHEASFFSNPQSTPPSKLPIWSENHCLPLISTHFSKQTI